MIKRFIEWYQYQSTLPMTEITPKNEVLVTLVEIIWLIGVPTLVGGITSILERWWKK